MYFYYKIEEKNEIARDKIVFDADKVNALKKTIISDEDFKNKESNTLIELIDGLLANDSSVIDRIINPDIGDYILLENEANKISRKVNAINNYDLDTKISELNNNINQNIFELNKLKSILKDLNIKRKELYYYQKLNMLINRIPDAYIPINELDRAIMILDFFQDTDYVEKYIESKKEHRKRKE